MGAKTVRRCQRMWLKLLLTKICQIFWSKLWLPNFFVHQIYWPYGISFWEIHYITRIHVRLELKSFDRPIPISCLRPVWFLFYHPGQGSYWMPSSLFSIGSQFVLFFRHPTTLWHILTKHFDSQKFIQFIQSARCSAYYVIIQ